MAAVVLMAIVVLPMMGYKKYRKHKARKALKKEQLAAQPKPLQGGHQAAWEQSGDQPPSYDDTVGALPSPPYSPNRLPGHLESPPALPLQSYQPTTPAKMMQRRMLSKEDEAATGADEIEVRREDQDKINKFSRLHQRELNLEDELKAKHKEKEDLEDISNELELADEEDMIPYQIGDSFISLPLPEVQDLLATNTTRIEEEVSVLEGKLETIKEGMQELKVELYARFGRSINLET
ncbi:hypothetical protein V490_07987 [Pseudogymnoascus sp. VKM F-3557]|nr:hypothetical protein V490_07987 [Pseudogymnoascus sp. VKM F-3557]